jgi:hypothetical protein
MRSRIRSLTAPIRDCARRLLEPAPTGIVISAFDRSWKLKTKKFPYSCTDEEGMAMFFTILANRLTSGFEISTAFGYSAAYIACALKKNGGRLVTMDCYIEESEESPDYVWDGKWDTLLTMTQRKKEEVASGKLPEGLALAQTFSRELDYADAATFSIGVSPHDVPQFVSPPLDFAFIDGGHFGDQPTLDYQAVEKFLAPKCAVFFHDNRDSASIAAAIKACAGHLQSEPIILPTRYHLTLVGRGLDPAFLTQLRSFCLRSSRPKKWFFNILARAGIVAPV